MCRRIASLWLWVSLIGYCVGRTNLCSFLLRRTHCYLIESSPFGHKSSSVIAIFSSLSSQANVGFAAYESKTFRGRKARNRGVATIMESDSESIDSREGERERERILSLLVVLV